MLRKSYFWLLFLASSLLSEEAYGGNPPNFVVMLMDDLGWGDLGCFGEPGRETPQLDRMAREGVLVPAMYASAPLCSPSRAALLTGRLPVRNGFYSDNDLGRNAYTPQDIVGGIADEETLLSELLQQAGYVSAVVGKWHLGHQEKFLPLQHGFDSYFGSPNCHFGPYDDVTTPNIAVFRDNKMVGRYYEKEFDFPGHVSNYTRLLTEEATSFIRARAADAKPFFLFWTPDSTHAPTYADVQYVGKSGRGRYGSAVQDLDAGVGAILDELDRNGLSNNTLVVFSSDNGAALVSKTQGGSNGPLLCGKQTTFEGGMRVPGIFWWPGTIPAGTTTDQVWTHMDFLPTFLELAGVALPQNLTLDGLPLSNTLLHPELHISRSVFLYRGNLLMAVRDGPYKLHLWTWATPPHLLEIDDDFCPGQRQPNVTTYNQVNHTDNPILYDVVADPAERYQISNTSSVYKTVVPQLLALVEQHVNNLQLAEPQLNWCDDAVMHWAPPGCEELGRCLTPPPSAPHLCYWDH
ncbi:N-acetylgalactosamine-6-sulfatase [Hyalella azteca]|uniref:N-acetylgalactosamine-6-sulfatase n=1 Tax=Hyalella azteca TaxID=294128 RepID=A0A8B7NHF0_HYAAZ|nr:N-acetylgalactosamine-6-sulfatase [Hyalella azteca]